MAEFILAIMMALLAWDKAPVEIVSAPHVQAHLRALAEEIARAEGDEVRLVTLAFRETRFGFREAYVGLSPKSSVGCGVFQQWPQFAQGGPVTCDELASLAVAVKQARAYLRYIERRWGKGDSAICHYFSGNRCVGRAQKTYTREHIRTLTMVRKWWKKGKV